MEGRYWADAERHTEWGELVGGIQVATLTAVHLKTPWCPTVAEVVVVSAFGMDGFTYFPTTCAGYGIEDGGVVATVLEHEAMAVGLLGGLDKSPYLVDGESRRNLHCHMAATTHGIDGQ